MNRERWFSFPSTRLTFWITLDVLPMPDIIKYFYEEPASLEPLTADDDPDARNREAPLTLEQFLASRPYYRGYLAGSSFDKGTIGLTTIERRESLLQILTAISAGRPATVYMQDPTVERRDPSIVVDRPEDVQFVLFGNLDADESALAIIATRERRRSFAKLRHILDQGVSILFPEQAHQGYDWSIFSPHSLLPSIRSTLDRLARTDLRVFAIPYNRARSEEKFYFEQYDLSMFADYELGRK